MEASVTAVMWDPSGVTLEQFSLHCKAQGDTPEPRTDQEGEPGHCQSPGTAKGNKDPLEMMPWGGWAGTDLDRARE